MAYDFDKVDDRAHLTQASSPSGDWSFGCHFFARSAGESNAGVLYIAETSAGGLVCVTRFSSAAGRLLASQHYSLTQPQSVTDAFTTMNVWYIIVVTFTAADRTTRIYKGVLDGVAMAEVTYAAKPTGAGTQSTTGTVLSIGNRTATDLTFDGRITRPFVSGRVLTLAEMEAYRTGSAPPSDSLRNYWPFASDANDVSGNNAHLTLNPAPTLVDDPFSKAASGSAIVSASSAVAATGAKSVATSASVSSASSVAATGAKSAAPPVSVSAASSVTSTGRKSTSQPATAAAVSAVTVFGSKRSTGAATVSATSSVVASGFIPELHDGSASIAATSTVNTTGAKGSRASVSISATTTAAGAGLRTSQGSFTLAAVATSLALGTKAGEGVATVTTASTLTAAGRNPTAFRRRSVVTPRGSTAATPRRSTVATPRRS